MVVWLEIETWVIDKGGTERGNGERDMGATGFVAHVYVFV
jgi:hypothetical protein